MTLGFECLWHRWPWLVLIGLLIFISRDILKGPSYILPVKRKILFVLRIFSILLILLVIFSPAIIINWNKQKKPEYVVVIDASLSMKTMEENGPRYKFLLNSLEKSYWVDSIKNKGAEVSWILFGQNALETQQSDIDSSRFASGLTDIGSAFDLIFSKENKVKDKNINGLILISDGLFNSGPDPLQLAATKECPKTGTSKITRGPEQNRKPGR